VRIHTKTTLAIKVILTLFTSITLTSGSAYAGNKTDWTGVYIGGFLGGGTGTQADTTSPFPAVLGESVNYNYSTKASFMGGGTVGYNYLIPKTPFLVGLEGEYGYLGMTGSSQDPNDHLSTTGLTGTHNTNIGGDYGYSVVGGRIGYVIDSVLVYIKGGASITNVATSYSLSSQGALLSPSVFNGSSNTNTVGFAIGTGVEYILPLVWTKKISIKAEYLYLGINTTQTSSGVLSQPGSDDRTFSNIDHIGGIHTAKFGVNYRF